MCVYVLPQVCVNIQKSGKAHTSKKVNSSEQYQDRSKRYRSPCNKCNTFLDQKVWKEDRDQGRERGRELIKSKTWSLPSQPSKQSVFLSEGMLKYIITLQVSLGQLEENYLWNIHKNKTSTVQFNLQSKKLYFSGFKKSRHFLHLSTITVIGLSFKASRQQTMI